MADTRKKTLAEELGLIRSVLAGHPDCPAKAEAIRAMRRLEEDIATYAIYTPAGIESLPKGGHHLIPTGSPGYTEAPPPGIDLRQFRPIVQKERTRLANSVDRMRWQLSEGLRPEVRGIVQPLFDEEQQSLSQADDLLALIDGQLPSALDYTQAPPPGIDLWPVVRQYIAARNQYEEAIRPLNSHAPVRKLPHGSPITRGWVDARELLRRAVGDPAADISQKKEQDNG